MKNMLKIFTFLSILTTFVFLSTDTSFAARNDPGSNVGDVKITITNDETGETTVLEDAAIKSQSKNNSVIEYDVLIPIGEKELNSSVINPFDITPFDESGGSKTSNGVKATLNVNYDLRDNDEEIRLNRVWGGWEPTHQMYSLSNRTVDAHSGSVWGSVLSKTPTSNSFDYNTGFGYNYFGGGDGSPRAWTSAKISITGMIATYTIKMEITFP